jgi:hypothetical protein
MSTISANNIIATVGITAPSAAISTINATTINATTVNMTEWGLSILKPVSNTLQIGDIFTQSLTLVASTITVSAQNTFFLGNVINVSTTNLNVTDNNINLNVSDSLGATVLSAGITILSGSNAFRTFQLNNNYDFVLSGLSVQNTLYANTLSVNTANISSLLVTTVSATNGIFNNVSTQTLNVSTGNISTLNVSQMNATNASIGLLSCTSGIFTNIQTTTISAATVTGVQNLNLSVLSVQSINVNNGQIYNNTTNGRVGINTSGPAAGFDVATVTRIRTISNNAYLDFTADVNGDGAGTMFRAYGSMPSATTTEAVRTYWFVANSAQVYSGLESTRCGYKQWDIYSTQTNNDSTVVGLSTAFTGLRPMQLWNVVNTADTTRISGTGFGLYLPYVSLSNLSHNIYPNVLAFGMNPTAGTSPVVPMTLHLGSGFTGSGGNNYGTCLQLTTHLSQDTQYYISAVPLSEALRVNGRSWFNKRLTCAATTYLGVTNSGSPGNETAVTGIECDSTLSTAVMFLHCVSNSNFATQNDARIRAIGGTLGPNYSATLELTAATISCITPMVQMSYACTYQMNVVSDLSASVGYIHNLSVGNFASMNGVYVNNNVTVGGYINLGQDANLSRERFQISGRELTTFIGEPVLSTYASTGALMTWGVVGYYPVKGVSTNTCTYTLSTDLTTYYLWAKGLLEICVNLRETAGTNVVRTLDLEVSADNVTWRTAYQGRSGYNYNATTTNYFTHRYDFLLDSEMENCKYFRIRYSGTSLGFGVNAALSPNGYCTRIMIKQIC